MRGGYFLGVRNALQTVQKIGGAKDGTLVFLQNLKPALNIGGTIGARLGRQFQIGAQKCAVIKK